MDYDTKKILYQINAETENYPASLTKMMTIYIVLDYLKKNKLTWQSKMLVSKTATTRSPSKLNLKEGTYISVDDAIKALIIKSANDVATVVAEHISGTEEEFAKLMTKYGKKIGMKKTSEQILAANVVIFLGKKKKKEESDPRFIYVLNKIDLKKKVSGSYDIKISALKGKNIKKLTHAVLWRLTEQEKHSNIILTSKRQKENVVGSKGFLKKSLEGLKRGASLELVVEDLNSSLSFLDNITKKTTKEDILSSVFSSFCVGK